MTDIERRNNDDIVFECGHRIEKRSGAQMCPICIEPKSSRGVELVRGPEFREASFLPPYAATIAANLPSGKVSMGAKAPEEDPPCSSCDDGRTTKVESADAREGKDNE
jgi:hypothetical protein